MSSVVVVAFESKLDISHNYIDVFCYGCCLCLSTGQILHILPLTSLISYIFTLLPGNFVLHLMIDFSVFFTSEQSRMVNALLLIRELTPGTSSHSLFGIRSL